MGANKWVVDTRYHLPESLLSPNEKFKYTIVNHKPISKQTQHGRLWGYFTIRFPALQNCLIILALCAILPIVHLTDFQPGNKGPVTEILHFVFCRQLISKRRQSLIKRFPVNWLSGVTRISFSTSCRFVNGEIFSFDFPGKSNFF